MKSSSMRWVGFYGVFVFISLLGVFVLSQYPEIAVDKTNMYFTLNSSNNWFDEQVVTITNPEKIVLKAEKNFYNYTSRLNATVNISFGEPNEKQRMTVRIIGKELADLASDAYPGEIILLDEQKNKPVGNISTVVNITKADVTKANVTKTAPTMTVSADPVSLTLQLSNETKVDMKRIMISSVVNVSEFHVAFEGFGKAIHIFNHTESANLKSGRLVSDTKYFVYITATADPALPRGTYEGTVKLSYMIGGREETVFVTVDLKIS